MNIQTFLKELRGNACFPVKSTDHLLVGNPEQNVSKIAVCMFPTVNVIRQAKLWHADLLITHEPLFYGRNNFSSSSNIIRAKNELLQNTELAIYRYHDQAHLADEDEIILGFMYEMGLQGRVTKTSYYGSNLLSLENSVSASDLAMRVTQRLNHPQVPIAGDPATPCTQIALCLGQPAGIFELMSREDVQLIIAGEICEWALAEYIRDAFQLGFHKVLMVLGHCCSEEPGMRYLAKKWNEKFPNLNFRYIDCGLPFTF